MHSQRRAVLSGLATILLGVGAGPTGSAAQAARAAPPKCDGPEYRQFDFWVGDWNVTTAAGRAGTNLVTLEESGCLVHEHWRGARGGTGQSFNFFDRADHRWHQVWVSSTGSVLRLTGKSQDDRLVFTGERAGPEGTAVRDRLTFFRNADGTVRQLWETSSDDGQSWQTVFDGRYAKRAPGR
jgi:hypothetical protein